LTVILSGTTGLEKAAAAERTAAKKMTTGYLWIMANLL
jgi:hypothetical protein